MRKNGPEGVKQLQQIRKVEAAGTILGIAAWIAPALVQHFGWKAVLTTVGEEIVTSSIESVSGIPIIVNPLDIMEYATKKSYRFAFDFNNKVQDLAIDLDAIHLMDNPSFKNDFLKIINDPRSKINFTLDGIDETPMNMILDPKRSVTNWEMNQLYQNKEAFEKTTF